MPTSTLVPSGSVAGLTGGSRSMAVLHVSQSGTGMPGVRWFDMPWSYPRRVTPSNMSSWPVTPAEREALEQLCQLRATAMEEMSIPGDDTFSGWLRWVIRKEAKLVGLPVVAPEVPEAPAPKTKRRTAPKRRK